MNAFSAPNVLTLGFGHTVETAIKWYLARYHGANDWIRSNYGLQQLMGLHVPMNSRTMVHKSYQSFGDESTTVKAARRFCTRLPRNGPWCSKVSE